MLLPLINTDEAASEVFLNPAYALMATLTVCVVLFIISPSLVSVSTMLQNVSDALLLLCDPASETHVRKTPQTLTISSKGI